MNIRQESLALDSISIIFEFYSRENELRKHTPPPGFIILTERDWSD